MAPLMTSARVALIWPAPALDSDGLLRAFTALPGMVDETKSQIVARALSPPAANWRFPTFVGPYQDATPAEDHLANMRTALAPCPTRRRELYTLSP